MIQIGHHKEFLKLTFLELASSSEQIQQLFVVWGSYTEDGATLLAGTWQPQAWMGSNRAPSQPPLFINFILLFYCANIYNITTICKN